MILFDKVIKAKNYKDVFVFYPIGDCHIGSRSCAESHLRKLIKEIKENKNAYAILGGDIVDAVLPQDIKRFDFDSLPDWILDGNAVNTRERLNEILQQQVKRATDIFAPIKDKIIGGLEGNHEFAIRKRYNVSVQSAFWQSFGMNNLTDECLIRIRFILNTTSTSIIFYLRHGYGSGRSAGAEPNKLARMIAEWECAEICLTGHTHVFDILPPKPVLYIPRSGQLPEECHCRYRWAANWGCWLLSHAAGASSYSSRACYPARPLMTCKATIKPFYHYKTNKKDKREPNIEIRQITM
jgi:hypothetical protein